MIGAYLRWRHRRGFGVHSPFAFRFVRDIVQPAQVRYYASDDVDRVLSDFVARHNRPLYKMLFRLVARLNPQAIYFVPGVDMHCHIDDVLLRGVPQAEKRFCLPGDDVVDSLILCYARDVNPSLLAAWFRQCNVVVIKHVNQAFIAEVTKVMPGGWTFEDRSVAIFVSNPQEPLNRLQIKLT